MSIVYFDSSAFVKLIVDEDGSELAAALWDGADAAVSSRLAYPEVCAALAAAQRARRLGRRGHRRAVGAWDQFWAAVRTVELTESVAEHAGSLAAEHALGGADAIHLASLFAVGGDTTMFAVWDQRLRTGAHACGVRLAPREAGTG